jgi:murein DD-endopeptidase MepM/ murein hydrolase activator NlpD
MRRKIWILVIVAVVLVGFVLYAGLGPRTGPESIPKPPVGVMAEELAPVSANWNRPVFGGIFYQGADVDYGIDAEPRDLGLIGQAPFALTLTVPEGFDDALVLTRVVSTRNAGDVTVYEGAASGFPETIDAGIYALRVSLEKSKEQKDRDGYGRLDYFCMFSIEEPIELVTGKLEAEQGDVVALKLTNVPDGVKPKAATELGLAVFVPVGGRTWFASVPMPITAEGSYSIDIEVGGRSLHTEATAVPFEFDSHNLVIDTSSPAIAEASSLAAGEEFAAKMAPLFETYDEERYWEGVFEKPCAGWISTNFGEIRYTNGDYSQSRRHNGMDIAAGTGTPVYAPNAGRVVFAEYLLMTGNTIVIEHGGGLKSYFHHLSKINIESGAMVAKGDLIGEVGSTGYSTGPHLHYETRIGDQPISPQMLFEEGAGLYGVG